MAKGELTADWPDIDFQSGFYLGSAFKLSEEWKDCPYQRAYVTRLLFSFALFGGDIFEEWQEVAVRHICLKTRKKVQRVSKQRDFKRQPLHPQPWHPEMQAAEYIANCRHLYQRILWFDLAMDPDLEKAGNTDPHLAQVHRKCLEMLRSGLLGMGMEEACDYCDRKILARGKLPNETMLIGDYVGTMGGVEYLLAAYLFVWLQMTIQITATKNGVEHPRDTTGKLVLSTKRFRDAFSRKGSPINTIIGITSNSKRIDDLFDCHARARTH